MGKTLTRRLEARLDEDTDELITQAAQLMHLSKSAFVTQVARAEAERVLARSKVTVMDSEVFDTLVASLDQPDEALEFAQRLSRLPRLARS